MVIHKKYQKEEKTGQNPDFSLTEKLRSLNSNDFYNLVQTLLEEKPEIKKSILEWFKDMSKDTKDLITEKEKRFIDEELLMEHWENARVIISEFNEYGGGSDHEEEECYDYLNEIEELAEKGNISTKAKLEFMDDLFKEYNCENSGFEDKANWEQRFSALKAEFKKRPAFLEKAQTL